MSKYQQFCESLWVGKARAEELQLEREEEERTLPRAVAGIVRRMCNYFQCPADQVRYVDAQANIVTGTVEDALPPVRYQPDRGRDAVDLEIRIGGPADEERYPVWLRLEFAPLKHGGLEFHFGSAAFQLPDEEQLLFDQVAEAINHELRKGYAPGPRKIGFDQAPGGPPLSGG